MLKANFRCQKYVKKGYIEMTKKIYLEPQKSVLGRSILHYWRRLQNALIKTNIFILVIRLQKTSSGSLQDTLIKTNIFVLVIRLQDIFKTFSKVIEHVFKRYCKNNYPQKDLPRPHISEIYDQDTNFLKV